MTDCTSSAEQKENALTIVRNSDPSPTAVWRRPRKQCCPLSKSAFDILLTTTVTHPRNMSEVTPEPVCAKEALELLNCVASASYDSDRCAALLESLRQCVLKKAPTFSIFHFVQF
ncbi:hypothetical protein EJ110_NYTH54556 [Nymphaea thermarum]|nr:hypothetical protein EJ110_NYTH54556 [Nymphaea thermarum]